MKERHLMKIKLAGLKKQRSEIADEFDKWPMFYTSKWFIGQMAAIDKEIFAIEFPANHPLNQKEGK